MAHGVVSGGRGYTAAAGLGVCVAPCLQTFQTKPDTGAARSWLCGRDAGVWQVPWLWARGGMTIYVSAARPVIDVGVVSVGYTGSLFRCGRGEWLRLCSATVFGAWPADLGVAGCGVHFIRFNHSRLRNDSRVEQ